ncbi:hypothetical protein [Colwellia sp. Arc7-D]|jgi:hypothetical protein|uniref:hypothetical protein n=1 Tax=Colwellia sp. Arc7-D TaxID=2161872 RepID=UPI000D334D07|nr:hypothetical protein [Colwellia sp. Arc7-D]AWB59211.1 hypothetical protein DBO93_17685 [Colwellia sp. Arc7-D]
MVKLSKTGWNNVIIFAVMGFILVINLTNKKIFSADENLNNEHEIALIGPQNIILTLSINDIVAIERIGRTWRATPANISGQALAQMMMSWQQSMGEAMAQAPEVDRQFSLEVKLDIAGQEQPLALNFYATEQQLLIFNQTSKQWLVMPIAMYGQLFPQEIFAG